MPTDWRGEIRPVLMSAIFVLLLPLLLIYGTFAVIDLWPVSTAVDEVAIFGMHSIVVAFATVAFLSHIKISAGEFAVFSLVGPFVSFAATAVAMGVLFKPIYSSFSQSSMLRDS